MLDNLTRVIYNCTRVKREEADRMSKDSIASVIMAKAAEMTDREAELAMAVAAAMQSGYELGRLSAQKDNNKASA